MKLKNLVQKALKTPSKGTQILLIRKGLSLTNLSGQLCGRIDVDLTTEGRIQAKNLLPVFFPEKKNFKFFSSDLQRNLQFANIVLGFTSEKILKSDTLLREINFGKHEGLQYDSLSKEEKNKIDNFDYKAPEGESWKECKDRMEQFFGSLNKRDKNVVFGHGGAICSFTYGLGVENCISPGSVIGIDYSKDKGSEVIFQWEYDEENIL